MIELPLEVEEWPGKARLTYAAKAATAATDPIAILLVIERDRWRAASRSGPRTRVGSDRADRERPVPWTAEVIQEGTAAH